MGATTRPTLLDAAEENERLRVVYSKAEARCIMKGAEAAQLRARIAELENDVRHLRKPAAPATHEHEDQSGDVYTYCNGCGACLTDEDVEAHGWDDCIEYVRREESAGVHMQSICIAKLEAERVTAADAWDEGYRTCHADGERGDSPNPYRKGES